MREFLRAVNHELFRSRFFYNLLALVSLLAVVACGYVWEKRYSSATVVTLAQSMSFDSGARGRAHLEGLVSLYHQPAFKRQIVEQLSTKLDGLTMDTEARIQLFTERSAIGIDDNGMLRMTFTAATPQDAQDGLKEALALLLNEVKPSERLDELADQAQLLSLEERQVRTMLEEKQQQMIDLRTTIGTADAERLKDRIASIREAMQEAQIGINALTTKIDAIQDQLLHEDGIRQDRQRLQLLLEQKAAADKRLEDNAELYGKSDPEMVSLQQEIDNLIVEINQLLQKNAAARQQLDSSTYQQLRSELALNEVERKASQSRYYSLKGILEDELKQASSGEAYSREVARVTNEASMLEDRLRSVIEEKKQVQIDLQQLREKLPQFIIVEKPQLPAKYDGLGLIEFLIAGPIVAVGLPFIAAGMVVLLDSRIRTGRKLAGVASTVEVPVLCVIPHFDSPRGQRLMRRTLWSASLWVVLVLGIYAAIGFVELKG